MSTLRFNLRTDKPDRFTKCPLELIYQISGQRKYYQVKDAKLNPINWQAELQTAVYVNITKAKKLLPHLSTTSLATVVLCDSEIETVNDNMTKIKTDIKDIERRFELDKIPYTSAMVIDALKSNSVDKTRKEEHKHFLFNFMDNYIADHLVSREAGSLSVYKAVKKHLENYQTETKLKVRFETIDYSFFQRFQVFLINRTKTDVDGNISLALNNTTIAKILSTLKTFLGYARKNGIKVHDSYKDFMIKREKLEVIALNEPELSTLLEMDLSENKRLDRVRDIFCFSCASGLRISDMQQLKWEHIKKDEINLTIKKTKTELTIPLNGITAAILNKYKDLNKPLPLISNQKLNTYIKELCKKARIDEPIEIVRFRGAKREANTLPKYELVHMHTGRKTFCTLSLEKGMSAEQVMSISGHTDYKSFKRYVDVTEKLKKVVMLKAWGAPQINLKIV